MGSPVRTYQKEIHDNLGFYATWLPGDQVEIGDIGVFDGGRFRRVTSLAELGIRCEVVATKGKSNLQITSKQGVHIEVAGGASLLELGEAKMSIAFSDKGAFLFHATGLQLRRLNNRLDVAEAVLACYERKQWQKDWVVVESVHTAETATIIISEDQSSALELVGEVKEPLASLSIADPAINLKVSSVRGKLFQMLGGRDLCPLYACLRVNDPIFSARQLKPVRGQASASELIERPGIEELLNS